MGEIEQTNFSTQIINVSHLPLAAPSIRIPNSADKEPAALIASELEKKRELLSSVLERFSIPLDEVLQQGLDLIKKKILEHAMLVDIPLDAINFPNVFVVKRENLGEISDCDPIFRSLKNISIGAWINSMGVIIMCDSFDNGNSVSQTLLISSLYHEFIHACIEKYIALVRHVQRNQTVEFYEVRAGIEVKNSKDDYGLFLNEMINHGFQVEFERELQESMESLRLKHELNLERIKRQFNLGPEDSLHSASGDVRKTNGSMVSIDIEVDALTFDENGSMYGLTAMLRRQIYLEIKKKVGKLVSDNSARELQRCMLRAKTNPSHQAELRDLLEKAIGNGFYDRLKHTGDDTDSMLDLLAELQKDE